MPTITATKLSKIVVNRPAPKPDGKNLWIDIDINPSKSTALIHSQDRELVGTHKQRTVTFRADYDCLLVFSKEDVFDRKSVHLIAHKDEVLHVKDSTSKMETFYDIFIGAFLTEGVETMHKEVVALNGPHIVVP